MKVCIITDNAYLYDGIRDLLARRPRPEHTFDFFYSPWNAPFRERFGEGGEMRPLRLKEQNSGFFASYDLFLSLHCKQLFPDELVDNHLCINVHPGYNPCNRGWFPQVFGIINKLPIGVTVHKMDRELDHGPILWQEKVALREEDTSKDIYLRILAAELGLLDDHWDDLLEGNYTLTPMDGEGNVNTREDFSALCEIDPSRTATYGEVIDYLRAMTFAPYRNAYFYGADGKKIYVDITLTKED